MIEKVCGEILWCNDSRGAAADHLYQLQVTTVCRLRLAYELHRLRVWFTEGRHAIPPSSSFQAPSGRSDLSILRSGTSHRRAIAT
jgi:hypothetical protein